MPLILKQPDNNEGGFQDENDNWLYRPQFTETASTGTNLVNYGLTELTSTAAKSYTLDAPVLGAYKEIVNTAGSTTINTVVVGSTVNSISVGGSSVARNLQFNGQNDSVVLRGISTTKWLVVANNSVTLATS